MKTVNRSRVALAAIAGAAVSLANAGDFSCSIAGWNWFGSGDFLDSANWLNCGLVSGPTTDLPIYFGPVEQFFNGESQGFILPTGDATLMSDYSSPSLTMATGTDITLSVVGATYTCPSALIGTAPTNFPPAGVATLELVNAVWDGNLTIGASAGSGRLILRGASAVTGSIFTGAGVNEILNDGDFDGSSLSLDGRFGANTTLRNLAGATLELPNGIQFSSGDGDDLVINEPGATIRKVETSNTSIGWDLDNAGTIEVTEGTLTLPSVVLTGALNIIAPTDAEFRLSSTSLGSDVDATVDGDGVLALSNVSGPGQLRLIGPINVSGGIIDTEVLNTGDISLRSGFDGRFGNAGTWRNAPGSTLELPNGSPFSIGDGDDSLINEAGATIRKVDTSTTTIDWDMDNAGTLDITEGTLTFSSIVLTGSLHAIAPAGAQLRLSTTNLGSAVVDASITGDGELMLGDVNGPGALRLNGPVRVSGGTLNTEVRNAGDVTLVSASFDGRFGNTGTWRNLPGSTLEIPNGSPFSNSDGDDLLVNEAGATIRKVGSSNTALDWDFASNGVIDVTEGTLRLSGPTVRSPITALVPADAELNLSGVFLTPDADAISITGDGRLRLTNISFDHDVTAAIDGDGALELGSINGPGALRLTGALRVSGGTLDTEIVNEGDVTLFSTSFDGRFGNAGTWRNANGATLELPNGSPFSNSDGDDLLINEPGATIRKVGSSNTAIDWDIESNGVIDVTEGTLRLSGPTVRSPITALVPAGAELNLSGVFLTPDADTVSITGDGTLRLSNISFDHDLTAAIDGDGALELGSIDGPGALRLTGALRLSGGTLDTEIINEGDVTLFSTSFDGRFNRAGTWRNAAGAMLELPNGTPFSNGDDDDFLINEPGATIRKVGSSTTSINWRFENQGAIEITEGTLSLPDGEPIMKADTVRISGAGTLEVNAAAIANRGLIAPTAVDPKADDDGLVIDTAYIRNDDPAVLRVPIGAIAGKLTCTGVYDVGGTIELERVGEFEPDGSEVFTIVEAEFITAAFGDHFLNAVPEPGANRAINVRTADLEYDVVYNPTSIVIENVAVVIPPCSPADLASPSGTLDIADVVAFLQLFGASDPTADLATPMGTLDIADVVTFLQLFGAGCP
ncbi:MAG: hypothetical protein CMJ31_11110 [Phycisphaerae bacterium]|nr:hypothetical protein [Phycisphaerae bacterium]